jgi:hypothetical protein
MIVNSNKIRIKNIIKNNIIKNKSLSFLRNYLIFGEFTRDSFTYSLVREQYCLNIGIYDCEWKEFDQICMYFKWELEKKIGEELRLYSKSGKVSSGMTLDIIELEFEIDEICFKIQFLRVKDLASLVKQCDFSCNSRILDKDNREKYFRDKYLLMKELEAKETTAQKFLVDNLKQVKNLNSMIRSYFLEKIDRVIEEGFKIINLFELPRRYNFANCCSRGFTYEISSGKQFVELCCSRCGNIKSVNIKSSSFSNHFFDVVLLLWIPELLFKISATNDDSNLKTNSNLNHND